MTAADPDRRCALARLARLAALAAVAGGPPLLGGGCAQAPLAVPRRAGPTQVVPFSDSPADGALPRGWDEYRLRRDVEASRYFTAEADGRTVLRAESLRGASGLRCAVDADPRATPWLQWSWRAEAVPEGARADDIDLDDSPARVVLAFDGDPARLPARDRLFFEQVEFFTGQRLPYAMLMYAWDATLPVGAVVPYARSGRIRRVVVHSGSAGTGRWLAFRRHVVEDFVRVFGEPPGRLVSVGVLTDADDLRQAMRCDYGDIALA